MYMGQWTMSTAAGSTVHRTVDLSGLLIRIWTTEIRLCEGVSSVLISIIESVTDG
jgi:hypothetical protein